MTDAPTRTRLIETAAALFRSRGYHGVGVNEILAEAGAPKGSLYHHFPNGKADLALAAAAWASDGMLGIIDDAFRDARDYRDGATTLCHKIAKFFDLAGGWDGCPISTVLLDGPDNAAFRGQMARSYDAWTARIADHAVRLGKPPAQARDLAETLLVGIQGSWILGRARRSSDGLRKLPARLFG